MNYKKQPMHWQRIRFLVKRLKQYRTEDEIINEIRKLKWTDFNENMSRFQIRNAKRYEYKKI